MKTNINPLFNLNIRRNHSNHGVFFVSAASTRLTALIWFVGGFVFNFCCHFTLQSLNFIIFRRLSFASVYIFREMQRSKIFKRKNSNSKIYVSRISIRRIENHLYFLKLISKINFSTLKPL